MSHAMSLGGKSCLSVSPSVRPRGPNESTQARNSSIAQQLHFPESRDFKKRGRGRPPKHTTNSSSVVKSSTHIEQKNVAAYFNRDTVCAHQIDSIVCADLSLLAEVAVGQALPTVFIAVPPRNVEVRNS